MVGAAVTGGMVGAAVTQWDGILPEAFPAVASTLAAAQERAAAHFSAAAFAMAAAGESGVFIPEAGRASGAAVAAQEERIWAAAGAWAEAGFTRAAAAAAAAKGSIDVPQDREPKSGPASAFPIRVNCANFSLSRMRTKVDASSSERFADATTE